MHHIAMVTSSQYPWWLLVRVLLLLLRRQMFMSFDLIQMSSRHLYFNISLGRSKAIEH